MEKKALDNIQHPFLIKTLNKVGIEGAFLNIIKAIYERPTANIILNGKKTKNFPTKIRKKTRISAFTTLIHRVWEVLGTAIRQEKEKKCFPIGKEEAKLSLFAGDKTVYTENLYGTINDPE